MFLFPSWSPSGTSAIPPVVMQTLACRWSRFASTVPDCVHQEGEAEVPLAASRGRQRSRVRTAESCFPQSVSGLLLRGTTGRHMMEELTAPRRAKTMETSESAQWRGLSSRPSAALSCQSSPFTPFYGIWNKHDHCLL